MEAKNLIIPGIIIILTTICVLITGCKKEKENITITDADGNIYNTVTIGDQVWMAENLKTTKYDNGDPIGTTDPAILDLTDADSPKYQWAYDGDENNAAIYGRLYTWNTVTDSRKLCPAGWHVPSDAEWTELTDYLGGLDVAGGKIKEKGTAHWLSPNTGATNESGFTAVAGGHRYPNGFFSSKGDGADWWSSTEAQTGFAWFRAVGYDNIIVRRDQYYNQDGFSVRCVRDE